MRMAWVVLLSIAQGFSTRAAAPPPAGYTVTITITHDFALADGTQADVVTVNVTSGGVPVNGLAVTFVINGGVSGINPVIYTVASGNAVLSLSSTVPGPVTVEAVVGGVNYGMVTVTFIASAGPPDLTNPATKLIVDQGTVTADGVSTDKIHAQRGRSMGQSRIGRFGGLHRGGRYGGWHCRIFDVYRDYGCQWRRAVGHYQYNSRYGGH